MAIAPEDLALLTKHRPVLWIDPQYDFAPLAVEAATDTPGNVLRRVRGETIALAGGTPPLTLATLTAYPDEREPRDDDQLAFPPDLAGTSRQLEARVATRGRLYGRVVRDDEGRLWLQYWFFLLDNTKHLLGLGRHQGDWEMVQIGLDAESKAPQVLTYAQHNGGESRTWGEHDHAEGEPDRPYVYVANLSHASYFKKGTHPYPGGIDDARADGFPRADMPVVPFEGTWETWPGRWGATLNRPSIIGTSPPSPGKQGKKWDAPGEWHDAVRAKKPFKLLGVAMHTLGRLTYPKPPTIQVDAPDPDGRVRVRWTKANRRGGKHLMLSLDDGEHVLAMRVLVDPKAGEEAILRVPLGTKVKHARASAFNVLRQRSDPAKVDVPAP